MENIFFNCVLKKKINVASKFLNENIDIYISKHLKNKIEGLCIDEGFVEPGTIEIIKKSIGNISGSRFTGDVTYEVLYTAKVCNPIIGNVIDCKVKFINKLGILGNNGPITIIVGKQFHTNDNELIKISENDIIKVEVIAKKFSLNDKEIKIIGKLWNENNINIKKDLSSSDITPIISENDYIDLDNQEYIYDKYDENDVSNVDELGEDVYSDEDQEDEEEEDDYDEEEEVKLENPENNIDADEIELEDDDDYEEDIESLNEFE